MILLLAQASATDPSRAGTAIAFVLGVAALMAAIFLLDRVRRTRPPAPAQPPPAADAADPHLLAAIAAAVHETLDAPHHILSVHPSEQLLQQWSLEGRRDIYSSHRIR